MQLKEARVTQIIKEVKLMGAQGGARAAAVNDNVREGTLVRTGTDSRSELTFTDLTITRLGANTIFSFNAGAREIDLAGGAVLLSVPRNGAAVKVNTAAVTAAITGGTALFEWHKGAPAKLLVMEGKGEFCSKIHPDECVSVRGGEMAMMTIDGRLIQPAKFDVKTVLKTSKLIVGFAPLPNADLIAEVIEQQQADFSGQPSDSPPPKSNIDIISTSTDAGGSGKFGPPSAITAPNPYVITSGTQINTDPTITTNGKTDFGKLYRGEAQDGPILTWAGATPSSFDNVNFFDSSGGGSNQPSPDGLPLAGFLFSGLQLDGNPTISNASGVPFLGFASQGGITSSASGAVFTFSGISDVALVALNGSINLSGISFENFERLEMYARGTGSNLTLAAPISNINHVRLRAEGSVQVNAPVTAVDENFKAFAGVDFQTGSTVNANQITIQSLGSINISNSAQLLAMLNSVGNNGQIVLIASGSDTAVNVGGLVQADQGEVDIRQTGVAGQTNLNNATLRGDVVKVSALGTNGVLTIASGNSINADTVIKLYAPGSNGTLNFVSNVTLTSPSNILAANTINIVQGAVVTINSANQADVFTNNPNYFGFGGNAPSPATAGTFGGAGAKDPQPLANAPPLGAPGQGP